MKSKISNLSKYYENLPINVKASFWFLISNFFQRGISFITTPVFTRLMSPTEYGNFSVFYSWYGIITIFVTLNLFFGVYVRGLVSYEEDKDIFTSSLQGLMLTLTLVWLGIYFLFADFFNHIFSISMPHMLAMFIIIWTNGAYSFWAAEQRNKLKYRSLVVLSMLTSVMIPVVQIILIVVLPDKVSARIWGMVIVQVICFSFLFVKHMKRGKVFFSARYWKYALSFNIPLLPHYLSQIILSSADRLMIKELVSADKAGIYSLSYSVSQIMTVFNSALMQTIEPWLYKKIKYEQTDEIHRVAYPSFILVAAVNIVLIAFAPEVIALFAPEEYYEAVWIVPPVAMGVFFMFIYSFFAVFQFYYEKTQYITAATLVGAALNILLNYIFIKRVGYIAAGYTTLLCYLLYSVFHYVFMKRLIRKNLGEIQVYNTRKLVAIIAVFLGMGFLLLLMYNMKYLRYGFVLILLIIAIVKRRKIIQSAHDLIETRNE